MAPSISKPPLSQATPNPLAPQRRSRGANMSVYRDRNRELEAFQFQMGPVRGRLAVALDLLTDALILTGQHGVYCQSARQPGLPAMDVQAILKGIEDAKELISDAMQDLKNQQVKPE